MNQQNSGGNNFQIGHAGNGNVFNVAQGGGRVNHVQLQIDTKSIQTFDKNVLSQDRLHGWLKFTFSVISIPVGFAADAYGLSDRLSFSVLWIFIPVALLLLIWAFKHMESWRILRGLPQRLDEAGYIGHNQIVEQGTNGTVSVYSRSAACIYPNCSGSIVLHPTPPREVARIGREYVGVCSICGKDHSYKLDYLWNAFPEPIDWRPIDEKK